MDPPLPIIGVKPTMTAMATMVSREEVAKSRYVNFKLNISAVFPRHMLSLCSPAEAWVKLRYLGAAAVPPPVC